MKPVKITSTQPTAVTPADSSSAGSDSASDFGPILKAASAAPAQGETISAAHSARGGASKGDASAKAIPDATSSPMTDRTGRRSGRDAASSGQPQADATAAACAAAAVIPGRTDSLPSGASPAKGSAIGDAHGTALDSSGVAEDPTATSSAIPKARAAALSDTTPAAPAASTPGAQAASTPAAQAALTPVAQAASTGAEASALQAPVNVNPPAPVDPHRVVSAQPPSIDTNRASAGQAAAPAPGQSGDAQSADDNSDDDGGADAQADSGFAALVPGSLLPASSTAQAPAHALSAQMQQSVPPTSSGTTSHAGSLAVSVPPNDPSGSPASAAAGSVTGAFGGVTAYPGEGRAAVATPVGQPGFGQEFSERVMVLARGGIQTAQISLQPAGLGPVGVSIQMHGHTASLVFTAQHEATRNALEAELPRLREMFAASGMQLSDASVGGRAQPDWSAPNHAPSSGKAPAGGASEAVAAGLAEPAARARSLAVPRLVDTYA
jgi:flagellar hook-length control protein FliK